MGNSDKESQIAARSYPPVVSVVGHVDHGKTTLLDAIRKSDIAASEKGGITQKIGASQIEIIHEGKSRKITFIDTPGHEAFSNMRKRGVSASDIALLVVAADDGVMPQTQESIKRVKEAGIPFIVVITKADLPTANVERVKQQLLKEEVLLEGLGGDVPYIAVSAKTGEKIHDLLDLILLVYDLQQVKKSEEEALQAVVIESWLDKRRGNLATIVIKQGKLSVGDKLFSDKEVGKVRALINPSGESIKFALPGEAVEIFGVKEILPVGSLVFNKETHEELLPQVSTKAQVKVPINIAELLSKKEEKEFKIVLKTQSLGELEAIKNSLPPGVKVEYEGQGDITASDILLAKDFGATIIGFNTNITSEAKTLAENEKVLYRIYNIIYELLDELADVMAGIEKAAQEVVLGRASVIASFGEGEARVLGLRVLEGRLALSDNVRLLRDNKVIGEGKIASLKRGKTDVKEVAKGLECGATISPFIDFAPGDVLISYR